MKAKAPYAPRAHRFAPALANWTVPLVLLIAAPPVCGQQIGILTIRFTPEPMAVPLAVLANARDLGRWQVEICNDSSVPVTLPVERVSMAAGPIRLIDSDDALLVLNSNVRKSTVAQVARYLSWAGRGAALGLAIASRSNADWALGLGIGSSALPTVIKAVQAEVPSAVPLYSTVKWPVVMQPGGCLTDHRFAAKMRGVKVVNSTIPVMVQGPVQPNPTP